MTNTMNTLDEALNSLITKTVSAAETAGGFVVQEAPIVIEQLLAWKFTISLLAFLVFMVIPLIIMPILSVKLHKKTDGVIHTQWMCLILMALLLDVSNGFAWLQIAIAPKVYLLEYATSLVK